VEKTIKFFIDRPLLVYLISILIVITGFLVATNLSRQVLPNVDMQQVHVETIYPAASARDVEINVTLPLEEKILEVDGIKSVRSISMESFSYIRVELDPDAENLEETKSDIRRAVDQVTNLPREIQERPAVYDIETSWIPVVILALSSPSLPEARLRKIAERMEKQIESLPGVSRVDKLGYRDREISVQVQPEKLAAYYLSLQDVANAIRARNIRLSGGSLESFRDETTVLTLAEFARPAEVGQVIVRSNFEGQRIVISDIADVEDGFADRTFDYRALGVRSIGLRVHKKTSADSLRVMQAVQKYLAEQHDRLPPDLVIQPVRDSTIVTRRRLGILGTNAVIGFVLLLAILITFLNLRVAFWTAMGIPIALSVGIALHAWTGGTVDSISVMVFILVLGMLVDDAIVVAENIHRYQEEGVPVLKAALQGVQEVAAPIAATVTTTIVAFLPIFALGGMLGLFVKMIPIIVMGTLLGSLLESFFILPSHLAAPGRKPSAWKERGALIDPLFKPARNIYRRFLGWCLEHRYWVVLIGVLLLGGVSYLAAEHMRFVLFPDEGAEEFYIHVETRVGDSLAATEARVDELEKIVASLPAQELLSYESFVGRDSSGVGDDMVGDNLAMVYVRLTPYGGPRQRRATDVIQALRAKTAKLEGFANISYELDSGGPPVGRAVELNLIGDDAQAQRQAVEEVLAFLRRLPGVLDPVSDLKYAQDEEVLHIDYAELAKLGLTAADVAATVRMAFEGDVVSTVRFQQEEVDIRVRLSQSSRSRLATLLDLIVRNHEGKLIPLRRFVRLERRPAVQAIRHFQGQRVITLTADVDNQVTTAGEIKDKVLARFSDLTRRYPGVRLQVTGEAEESSAVMRDMVRAGILAVLAIYFILVLLFNSLVQPLIILVAIPFGVIGVILAFWVHGLTLGFMALIGMLGMSGVVVNDSLIILSFINHLARERNECENTSQATILDAAQTRLRPVILTTLTTAVALLPTAYGLGGADPFIQPMVLAMLWGIVFATVLTLLWVPTIYSLGQNFKRRLRLGFQTQPAACEPVPPPVQRIKTGLRRARKSSESKSQQ